ncbi:hypothetical protein ASD45_09750 [Pseudolabrys sp. Root1462]|nr:hypothetical protein ASD45_09750 [Pseudolabrys sp. Root1462]
MLASVARDGLMNFRYGAPLAPLRLAALRPSCRRLFVYFIYFDFAVKSLDQVLMIENLPRWC